MSKFTDRLWQELMRGHRAELEKVPWPAADRRRRALPRLLAGTTVGLAGAGTAIALAIGAASSSPAFAVTKNPDGSVSVMIRQSAGIAGANQKLAQYGIRAVAVPVVAGCAVGPPPPASLHAALVKARTAAIAASGGAARIYPDKIPPGKRLVFAAGGGEVSLAQVHGANAPAPQCFRQVLAAPWCRPASGGSGTSTDTTTTGTVTAPPPTTNTNTTTGTTTGPQTQRVPGHGFTCGPPPPFCGGVSITRVPPGASTNTTRTATAPPPPTNTATTETAPTDTTTTGTSTGQTPLPAPRMFARCAPPPCAVAQKVASAGNVAALAHARAKLLKMRAQLAKVRGELAKAHAAGSSKTH